MNAGEVGSSFVTKFICNVTAVDVQLGRYAYCLTSLVHLWLYTGSPHYREATLPIST